MNGVMLVSKWNHFFEAMKAYREDPTTLTGLPELPGCKDKEKGRFILIHDKQALGKRAFQKTGQLIPSGLPMAIATRIRNWEKIAQVRMVSRVD